MTKTHQARGGFFRARNVNKLGACSGITNTWLEVLSIQECQICDCK